MNVVDVKQATQKQLDFIKIIEGYTCIKFTGTTKKEASEYISENYEMYKKVRKEEDSAMNENNWAISHGYF